MSTTSKATIRQGEKGAGVTADQERKIQRRGWTTMKGKKEHRAFSFAVQGKEERVGLYD